MTSTQAKRALILADLILVQINHVLAPLGVMLIPRPPSAKMLREHANVAEHHPIGPSSKTVAWMRSVADQMGGGPSR